MTLVLCGSLGATAEMWGPQLSLDADPVCIEHPGHGLEPVRDVDGVAGLGEGVLESVEGPFDFVGLSLGGAVGMWLAAHHPERVERLVVACSSARFGTPEQWRERAAIVRAQGLEAIVDAVLARWFGPGFAELDRYRAMFLSVDAEGYARCCDALAGIDATPYLGRIAAPTLVIAGSEDPTSPPVEGRAIASAIGGARFAEIERAHHLSNVERPEQFNEHVRRFLHDL